MEAKRKGCPRVEEGGGEEGCGNGPDYHGGEDEQEKECEGDGRLGGCVWGVGHV